MSKRPVHATGSTESSCETHPPVGRVLHTGQAIVDIVMQVAAMPPIGGDVYARSSEFTAGGGFNVMAAAARDGGIVVYLGARGDGPFGSIVGDALAAEGVTAPASPVVGEDTGYCVAVVDDAAERTFISFLGAEGQVTLDNLRAVDVHPEDIVYVTGYSLLHEVNRESLLTWLPKLPPGARVVFDPSPLVEEIPADAFDLMVNAAWLWTLNAREAALTLARLDPDHHAVDVERHGSSAMASALALLIAGGVVVRSGREGAYLVAPHAPATTGEARHVPGMRVTPIDTNGAGDAHTGVLCACLARGGDLDAAVHRANLAAAIAVTRPGPATSPRTEEIDALSG